LARDCRLIDAVAGLGQIFAETVVFHLSMIFSENRFPLFGIML